MPKTKASKEREFRSELNQERIEIQDDLEESSGATPKTVINNAEFMFILIGAVAVDAIDALDLTGFGAILARFIDIPTLGILWLWRILKGGSKKDPTFQILLAFLVELSPVGMIPSWTIFVIYIYSQDTKIGKETIKKAKKVIKIKK